jgi:DNA-binding GntR family transcriptional regulator
VTIINNLTEQKLQPDSRTLASKTYEDIKADIVQGIIPQGAKIVESDLALKYGISRGPLREAIHRLEQLKLIVRVPHAGSKVVTLDSNTVKDIYQARESLEGMAARLAARLMSDEEIDSLRKLLENHQKTISQSEGHVYFQSEGDIDFHFRIAAASQNSWILEKLNGELYQLIRMCRLQLLKIRNNPHTALEQHRQIALAIANRDEELAEILMRRHISGAWKILEPLLET